MVNLPLLQKEMILNELLKVISGKTVMITMHLSSSIFIDLYLYRLSVYQT